MIQKINREISPEEENFLRGLIKNTLREGRKIFIERSSLIAKSELNYNEEFEGFEKVKSELERVTLHLIKISENYLYWPIVNIKDYRFKIADIGILFIDSSLDIHLRICFQVIYGGNELTPLEKIVPSGKILSWSLYKLLSYEYRNVPFPSHFISSRKDSIIDVFEDKLKKKAGDITVEDLCNNFQLVLKGRRCGKRTATSLLHYLRDDLRIPEDIIDVGNCYSLYEK
jgi:hypothetical protein